jgi:16S rRNA (cytosine1402-N4)-methyltransferase
MGALKELLEQLHLVLKPGGRAAIITFHSIEDRMVKLYFRDNGFDLKDDNPFVNVEKPKLLSIVNKKPIVAGKEELKKNSRSRSAKLRLAEKI